MIKYNHFTSVFLLLFLFLICFTESNKLLHAVLKNSIDSFKINNYYIFIPTNYISEKISRPRDVRRGQNVPLCRLGRQTEQQTDTRTIEPTWDTVKHQNGWAHWQDGQTPEWSDKLSNSQTGTASCPPNRYHKSMKINHRQFISCTKIANTNIWACGKCFLQYRPNKGSFVPMMTTSSSPCSWTPGCCSSSMSPLSSWKRSSSNVAHFHHCLNRTRPMFIWVCWNE